MMEEAKKEMENKALEAARKAAEAVKAAVEPTEADPAPQVVRTLSDSELEHVAGGSSWDGVPNPEEHPYPVDPDPKP